MHNLIIVFLLYLIAYTVCAWIVHVARMRERPFTWALRSALVAGFVWGLIVQVFLP